MGTILTLLAVVGVVGLLGMTCGFPILAVAMSKPNRPSSNQTENELNDLTVLIPAHNEAETIAHTIASIQTACKKAKEHLTSLQDIRIIVIANRCTDTTCSQARSSGAAEVLEYNEVASKWQSLKYGFAFLKTNSNSPKWIALVDSGACWPDNLLVEVTSLSNMQDVVGIAPAYQNPNASLSERCSWRVERALKSLENRSGGPISVHGATVFYRTEALENALNSLGDQLWINDDVVLPLAIRCLHPTQRIVYLPSTIVTDQSSQPFNCEKIKRVRLVQGNLEWISQSFWYRHRTTTLLALRRVFRVAWGFWLLCLLAPIWGFGLSGVFVYGVVVVSLLRLPAFSASLKAPLLFLFPKAVKWK